MTKSWVLAHCDVVDDEEGEEEEEERAGELGSARLARRMGNLAHTKDEDDEGEGTDDEREAGSGEEEIK